MPGQMKLIGVYSLPVDEQLVATQARELYGETPSPSQVAQVRKQLGSIALAEVLVTDADERFNVGDFTQEDPKRPRQSWQAAWAEAFLSPDGETLLVKRWGRLPPNTTAFRIAFYLHFWKTGQPLLTSYGPIPTPAPAPMPERLVRLVPYIPVG
jgi:hypothetical protein